MEIQRDNLGKIPKELCWDKQRVAEYEISANSKVSVL